MTTRNTTSKENTSGMFHYIRREWGGDKAYYEDHVFSFNNIIEFVSENECLRDHIRVIRSKDSHILFGISEDLYNYLYRNLKRSPGGMPLINEPMIGHKDSEGFTLCVFLRSAPICRHHISEFNSKLIDEKENLLS